MTFADTDHYYMNVARKVGKRSKCSRLKIGAIIVSNGRVVAEGYNGTPRGYLCCSTLGCLRDKRHIESGTQQQFCRAIHAEQYAIMQAAHLYVTTVGATLYSERMPCIVCTKMIIHAGITRVVFDKEYPNKLGVGMLATADVVLEQLQEQGDVLCQDATPKGPKSVTTGPAER